MISRKFRRKYWNFPMKLTVSRFVLVMLCFYCVLKWNRNKGYDSMTGVTGLTLNPFVSFQFYVALWPVIFVASVLILFWKERHSCSSRWDLIQLNGLANIPKKLKITHPQLGSLALNKIILWAQKTVDNWPKYLGKMLTMHRAVTKCVRWIKW